MATGQTIETKITVDAKQATAEIERLKNGMTSAETAIAKVGAALPAVERNTQSAGMRMLILGQAVDDVQYGLRGVVNNMPQVVQAFGGSLGLAGGIGIAAVAISQLSDKYEQYQKIQEEVTANMSLWRGALADVDKALREGVNKRTTDLTQALKDAQDELRDFGKTSRQIAEDEAALAVATTEKQLATLEKNLPSLQARVPQGRRQLSFLQQIGVVDVFTEQEKEDFKMQNQLVSDATARRKNLTEQLQKQKQALGELAAVNKQIAEKESAQAKKTRADEGDSGFGRIDRRFTSEALQERIRQGMAKQQAEEERRAREMEANMRELVDDAQKFSDQEKMIWEKAEKEKTKIAKKEIKERQREEEKAAKEKADAIKAAEKSTADFQVGLAQSMSEQLLSSAQGYVDAKIKGEKDAEQKAIASFLSATGQQLVASGTRAIFEGAIISANPLTPGAGVGMIATGVAAVGAGLAMGAGGAAIAPPAGGGATSAARDRGASPRSVRGGGEGGPLVVNVAYGVAGPLPEDTAREIAKAVKTGNRRRGAA